MVRKTIFEIDDVVFDSQDLEIIGSTVVWSPKTTAHHLHVLNGAEDGSGDQDHVGLWSIDVDFR
jgi:hypothetical protein